jgi:hypothetical protein
MNNLSNFYINKLPSKIGREIFSYNYSPYNYKYKYAFTNNSLVENSQGHYLSLIEKNGNINLKTYT